MTDPGETRTGSFSPAVAATAADRDSDGDGYEVGVELRHGSNPLDPASHPPAVQPYLTNATDSDGDRAKDHYEYSHGTDWQSAASKPPLGDIINGNGAATSTDATILQRILTGALQRFSYQFNNCDLNRSGTETSTDATLLQRYLTNSVPTLPTN